MTILITGAGLIGTAVAQAIELGGGSAVLLDNAPDEAAIRNAGVRGPIVRASVADAQALDSIADRHEVDAVVHTAVAQSAGLRRDPRLFASVNIGGTANVLETGRRMALRRVVLIGSTTVTYASFDLLGATDTVPEDCPLSLVSARPRSLYAASKVTLEFMAQIWREQYAVPVVVLRFAAVLGHWHGAVGLPTRAVLALVEAGLDGRQATISDPLLYWSGREEFIDVRDGVAAVVSALTGTLPPQTIYSIAHPQTVTHDDLCAAARVRWPGFSVAVPARHDRGFAGNPFRRPAPSDTRAATRDFGFSPAHPIASSVDAIAAAEVARRLRR